MTIATPPTFPNPANPSTFNANAVAWFSWLANSVPDFNTLSGMTNSGMFLDGTVAAPGITFASDTNTGFYRVGAEQIGFSTNGVQRALLSTTALTVNLPITGTAVQSSASDATAGKLLTNGAFGLGQAAAVPTVANIDATTTPNGFWRYTTGATGTFPTGVTAAAGGTILMVGENTNTGYMILQPTGTKLAYFRNLNTTWGAWQLFASTETAATAGQVLRENDAATAAVWSDPVQRATTAATTSGTNVAVTGIPSWARRVTIALNAVSVSGTNRQLLQLGSGSVQSTGYSSNAGSIGGTSNTTGAAGAITNGFALAGYNIAATQLTGVITLVHVGSNVWIAGGSVGDVSGSFSASAFGGSVTLSGALDRINLTTNGGTDTFDGGSVTVFWE